MSIWGCATRARQSSLTWVAPDVSAASSDAAAERSVAQPTRARLVRALAGARSAMPARWTPGVFGTCARYMVPNLPAPIRPTRSGLPCAARSESFAYRFIFAPRSCGQRRLQCRGGRPVPPRQRDVVIGEQAIGGLALQRREV